MRWLKRIAIVLAVLVVAFLGAGLFMAWKYGDIVRNVVIDQLNQTLQSEMKVSSIDVSSIEKAPYLSLQFNQVALMEPKSYSAEPDTLFYFDKLYLQFNLWDIFQGNYQIRKVEIAQGFAHMRVNREGVSNYDFLQADTSATDTSVVIGLNEIKIIGVDYEYLDLRKAVRVETQVKEAQVSGEFLPEKLNLDIDGVFDRSLVRVDGATYLNRYHLKIKTALGIGGELGGVEFERGSIRVENQLKLHLTGRVNEKLYAFQAAGKNMDLAVLRHLLPHTWKEPIKDYHPEGELDLDLKIRGDVESDLAPRLDIEYSIRKGWIRNIHSDVEISDLACEGSFTNGKRRRMKSMVFDLDTVSFRLPSGKVSGEMKLSDLNQKNLEVHLQGKVDLSELQSFLKLDEVELLDGDAKFSLAGKTALQPWIKGNYKPNHNPFRGQIEVEGLAYKSTAVEQNLSDFAGVIAFDQEGILFQDVTGVVAETKINLEGELFNFYPWLFQEDKKLRLVMNVEADQVKLENFLGAKSQREEAGEDIPLVEMQLSTQIGRLTYRRFEANNVKMRFYMGPTEFKANPVEFDGMDGHVSGKFAVIDKEDGQAEINAEGQLDQIDVQQLFYQFEDFGQTEIRSGHLRGKTDMNFRMIAQAGPGLQIDPDDIDAYAHIVITGGELKNYATLQAISDYVKSSLPLRALIKEKELRKELNNVRFDRLENDVFIGEGRVYIPRMEIRSSILGLHVDGTHSFSNQVDYHLDFDLSELLVKKKDYNTEFGYVADDGTGRFRLFLMITGDASDPEIDLDRERKKAYRKERRKNQENEILNALSKELGISKSDEDSDTKREFDYQIEWEEEEGDSKDSVQTKPRTHSKDTTKKKFKLLQPNEEETEYFEYDDL